MSVGEFFAMRGYGFYIWSSYGMALAIFIMEIALVRHKRKITLRQLRLMRNAEEET
jgi:heme exporter protein D